MAAKSKNTPTSISFTSVRELRTVRRAARLAGKSVSRFLRDIAIAEAERVIVEHDKACPHCGAGRTSAAA